MRPHQARFVTACQQLLALGVVLAVLTPAAAVVSLDVTGLPGSPSAAPSTGSSAQTLERRAERGRTATPARHEQGTAPSPQPAPAGETPAAPAPAQVPAGVVEPTVTEVPLTPEEGEQPAPEQQSRTEAGPEAEPEAAPETETDPETDPEATTTVVSEPQDVEGYGAIGITWSSTEQVDDTEIGFELRTRDGGEWSDWSDVEYHDEHGPDPASPESEGARPGTDPVLVGEVDEVQVRAVATRALPADMSLAVIEPGDARETTSEEPALTAGEPAAPPAPAETGTEIGSGTEGEEAIELRASTTAPRPTIFSRAQWGADESMRDRSSLRYGTISAGFVHHTVNANDYSRADVPGIIRGIYAYHVRSQGWSDIGYNFLVDKFGRIWEGRAGGVDRPVVGAHTLGYNDYSFAMSAIGNFDVTRPPDVMLRAYGDLFAWKLGLHGVDPMDGSQRVGSGTFKAINGHRDAGSTACPGRYLYERLATIRTYAADAATPLEPKQLSGNLAGSAYPDLVVRRASDNRGLVVPTGGLTSFGPQEVLASSGWSKVPTFFASADLTGDDVVDLVTTTTTGTGAVEIRPGSASGRFGSPTRTVTAFEAHSLLAAVGDLDGDGRNDLVGRYRGALVSFLGTRRGGFRRVPGPGGFGNYTRLVGAGDLDGDGRTDILALDRWDRLTRLVGDGAGGIVERVVLPGDWSTYDEIVGGVDYTYDGLPDLVLRRTDGDVFVRPGRGDGDFAPRLGPINRMAGLASISGAGQVVGSGAPDLLARRRDTLVAVTNRGTFDLGVPIDTGRSFRGGNLLVNASDFDKDGKGDVLMRRVKGGLMLYRGNGAGKLAEPVRIGVRMGSVRGLTAVGDLTGDGWPDLIGRPGDKPWMLYPGHGADPLGTRQETEARPVSTSLTSARDLSAYDWVVGVADLRLGEGADLLVRRSATGRLYRVNQKRSGQQELRYLGEGEAWNLGG